MKRGHILAAICVTLGLGAMLATSAMIARHTTHAHLIIEGKERLTRVSGSGGDTSTSIEKYVYANGEAYNVSDSIWLWHFRSLTVYASIPVGGTCDVVLSGYRLGWLSLTQNIVSADCKAREVSHDQ